MARVTPTLSADVRQVAEQSREAGLHRADGALADLPWLVHGITARDHDMSLFGSAPVGSVIPRWTRLRDALGLAAVIHARQVHGADALLHDEVPPGLHIGADADGHVTARAGLLLAVSVADCVPIYLAAAAPQAVALLHGGWRGVAAGVLEAGVSALGGLGAAPDSLHMHLGPAICGRCYEVGAEVPAGLGLEEATGATHVDLRAAIVQRARGCGIEARRITVSTWCTRHGDSAFYSHRGGCRERQIAVLGMLGTVT